MKKLTNLKGAKTLSSNEQKVIIGGRPSLSCFGKNAGDPCGTNGICCHDQQFQYLFCYYGTSCPYGAVIG